MCGIIAMAGKGAQESDLSRSLEALSHRGPDDAGAMRFQGAALGHTRLAIIDLSPSGHQPMRDQERNQAIVFNGEIYNYKELRAELEKLGHTFATDSDTEAILKAYTQWGKDAPMHLDGMFAFAIWNADTQEMFMARDRFGKKPLYYAHDGNGRLIVASEIKALFAAGIVGEIDPAGIDAYLTLMYLPPWRTVYKNIHTLLPAHAATYKNGALDISRYWELPHSPIAISYDDAKEEIRRLFGEAVRKRMIADVEVGVLLSGGVDSTIATAYARRHMDRPIKTFSLGYGDYINELPFAKQASDAMGTEHYTLQASSDLTKELEKTLAYFDEPHGDSADFPQHLVSELAASKVKVALAGDGGDELFMGYGSHVAYWNRPKLKRLYNAVFSNPYQEHLHHSTVFPKRMRDSLLREPVRASEDIERLTRDFPGRGIEKIDYFDISMYLPGQLLTKVDRMSMMHGLEVRCPFLDYQLAEFAFNIPTEYKTDRRTGKIILKDLLAEIMPREFVDRKKQGFGAPVRKWLTEPAMREYVEKRLGDGARVYEYLRPEAVQAFVKDVCSSDSPKRYYQLWVLLCLELWLRR